MRNSFLYLRYCYRDDIYIKLKSKYCLLLILFIIITGTVLEGFALSFLNLYKQLCLI